VLLGYWVDPISLVAGPVDLPEYATRILEGEACSLLERCSVDDLNRHGTAKLNQAGIRGHDKRRRPVTRPRRTLGALKALRDGPAGRRYHGNAVCPERGRACMAWLSAWREVALSGRHEDHTDQLDRHDRRSDRMNAFKSETLLKRRGYVVAHRLKAPHVVIAP
jgi:hypothetical protein